jgi:hypothetical protein
MTDFERGLGAAVFECERILMKKRVRLSDADDAENREILVSCKAIKDCIAAINTRR